MEDYKRHFCCIKHTIIGSIMGFAVLIACEPIEEKICLDSSLKIVVSTDTVTFDTIFTSLGSITKRLKVYNPNNNAMQISRISLGKGNKSPYAITVNGERGNSIEKEIILGYDSLLILVEVIINPKDENLPFLVKDSLLIEFNGNTGYVTLVAWGQDAHFIKNKVIECNTHWTADKPYVLYNQVLVDTLCTLTVEKGVRIYLDNNTNFFVKGSLKIEGTADQKVIIRNTRLDLAYHIAPGQWGAIFFLEGSTNNRIDHAEIRNGQIGLRVGNPDDDADFDLVVSNTSIGHMSMSGIDAYTSDIQLINTEIFHCQQTLFAGRAGGHYQFQHCTFSNSPNQFFRDGASVVFANTLKIDGNGTTTIISGELIIDMQNSIVWGSEKEELLLDVSGEARAITLFKTNIIKSKNKEWEAFGNKISQEEKYPRFYRPILFNFQIDSISPARNTAVASTTTHDLLDTKRDAMPDIGAYERKDSIP